MQFGSIRFGSILFYAWAPNTDINFIDHPERRFELCDKPPTCIGAEPAVNYIGYFG
jgi:hypothetical protein